MLLLEHEGMFQNERDTYLFFEMKVTSFRLAKQQTKWKWPNLEIFNGRSSLGFVGTCNLKSSLSRKLRTCNKSVSPIAGVKKIKTTRKDRKEVWKLDYLEKKKTEMEKSNDDWKGHCWKLDLSPLISTTITN